MHVREEFKLSAAAAAAALVLDFASGRALSVFYAQMGSVSWLGIFVSGLLFGAVNCALVHLARRAGTQSFGDAFRRLCGPGPGGFIAFLYHIALAAVLCMLAVQAGHVGLLALPLRNAALWGLLCALFLAAGTALSGSGVLRDAGALLAACFLLFELALLLCSNRADMGSLHYALVLRLRGNRFAALGLGILYTCAGLCISAGLCTGTATGRVRAHRAGIISGGIYLMLLALGNAVLQGGREEILALELPFVAMAGEWGSGGFYISAALIFLSCVLGMAAVLRALLLELACGK